MGVCHPPSRRDNVSPGCRCSAGPLGEDAAPPGLRAVLQSRRAHAPEASNLAQGTPSRLAPLAPKTQDPAIHLLRLKSTSLFSSCRPLVLPQHGTLTLLQPPEPQSLFCRAHTEVIDIKTLASPCLPTPSCLSLLFRKACFFPTSPVCPVCIIKYLILL